MLVQLSRIGTGFLVCSWSDSNCLSCMNSWFDSSGLSLVCSWLDSDWLSRMMWATNWLVQLDWTGWLYMLMSSVIQWIMISWRAVIKWWAVVSSGSCCVVWYILCSVVQVLISRSTGSVRSWFNSFYLHIRVAGRARKGGCSLLSVVAGELGSWSFL